MRYLGIDFGSKHIGIAISDEQGTMAFPHASMSNTKNLAGDIAALAAEKGVGEIVIGESRDYQGNENPIMAKAHAFAKELGEKSGLPIHFELEFMTSVEARHIQGSSEKTHSSASAIILQSFLDKRKNQIT